MQVSELMSRDVRIARPDQPIGEVARVMRDADIGALPVGDGDRLVGVVTDRDIVIRAVADGRAGEATVREVMSDGVKYCYADEDVETVARNLGEQQIRRLPVLNRDKRLVGILALGDIATSGNGGATVEAIEGISS